MLEVQTFLGAQLAIQACETLLNCLSTKEIAKLSEVVSRTVIGNIE